MKNFTLLLITTLFSLCINAQEKAIVRGVVIDQTMGETLPGAVIKVPGTRNGARADLDGKFTLEIEPGTYDFEISFVGFEPVMVSNITLAAGETKVLDNIYMGEVDVQKIDGEVNVSAQASRKSENAMLTIKKLSTNVIDGITADNFRKIGDGDAAASIKRVPGVSITNGKYVYVRGLGDRYTKTTLNGIDIPGLDPDRNSLQMDIFPTQVMDNIVVNKSFVADLPADFTGGIVDIGLKDFPETKTISVNSSLGYNPDFHFKSDYLDYQGGKLDWMGVDDGMRAIPATKDVPFFSQAISDPNGPAAQRYSEILNNFSPYMAAHQKNSFADFSLGASIGNQINKANGKTHGYNFLLNYKNKTKLYRDIEYARYGLDQVDPSNTEMEQRERQVGTLASNEALTSIMGGYAIKSEKKKYVFNLLHVQNGESSAGIFDYNRTDQGTVVTAFQHNLGYSQKSLTNFLASGKYNFTASNWELEWKASPTYSRMYDPDIRSTRYVTRDGSDQLIIGTEGGLPVRIWRDLSEINMNFKTDAVKKISLFSRDARLKTGAAYLYKDRDYAIYRFDINPKPGSRLIPLTGNPDELFFPQNLWPNQENPTMGVTYEADFIPNNTNQYQANVSNIAAYGSLESMLTPKLKTILGVRLENFVQRYTGTNQNRTEVFENDVVLDNLGVFPSLNMVYNTSAKSNLRFSATRTTARPSMKELSYAEIQDPLTGRTFVGGLFTDIDYSTGTVYWDGNLVSTMINNIDLRYEIFPSAGNTFSVGGFYKSLTNPIEMVQSSTQPGTFQPRNVGDGQVIGGELEFRHDLEFISPSLKTLSLNLNLTYTQSKIKYSLTEKESRENNKRTGQTIGDGRQMAGQAPYMINGGFIYNGAVNNNGWEAGLFYNVQGPTLMYVGIVDRPDVFTRPFHSLDFNMNKLLGKDDRFRLGLNVTNILGDKREEVYQSYQAQDQIFTSYSPGRLFKLSCSYTIQ